MIVGLTGPDAGRVLLDDSEITRLPMYIRARCGLSYLPQEPSIFKKLTVEENILAVLETVPISDRQRRERLEELIEDFGLQKVRRSFGYVLSGGERRRTEMARALAISPCFILLDEPLSGIDPLAVLDIQQLVGRLKNAGMGILMTDHNVRETLQVTDRAYIINGGRILRAGTPEELGNDSEVKKVYLGDNFRLAI
jgi:lipopolysaccharide export system ATP-binding protein